MEPISGGVVGLGGVKDVVVRSGAVVAVLDVAAEGVEESGVGGERGLASLGQHRRRVPPLPRVEDLQPLSGRLGSAERRETSQESREHCRSTEPARPPQT